MADPMQAPTAPHPIMSGGTFGLMSGEKPTHRPESQATHEHLVGVLKGLGLPFEETHSRYEQPQRNVIVHQPTRDQIYRLGKMFGQESVVFSQGGQHELLYTNGEHDGKSRLPVPGAPAIESFQHPPVDYYTHLPGRGYIRFNFDWQQDPRFQGPRQVDPAAPPPQHQVQRQVTKSENLRGSSGTHPHAYPWHEGNTSHHLQARNLAAIHRSFGKSLEKADNDQAAGAGVSSYARFAGPYGQVLGPGQPTNLRHYPYEGRNQDIDNLVKRHGYQVYYAGGRYGKPDLAQKNYNTGHLMVYDPSPASGGDFNDERYTDSWRKIHELSHALTYPELNKLYGEGRRIGKLGVHRTPNEAMRAVHWEWLAGHKQRELGEQLGIKVPDETFHRELNTVMHDAVHRAVTGQFTEPSAEGFAPHSHKVDLSHALDTVREHAQAMGITGQHQLAPKAVRKALLEKGWPKNATENADNAAAHMVLRDSAVEGRGLGPITPNNPAKPPKNIPQSRFAPGGTVHDTANPAAALNESKYTSDFNGVENEARIHNNAEARAARAAKGLGRPAWPYSTTNEPHFDFGQPAAHEVSPSPNLTDANKESDRRFWEVVDSESQGLTVGKLRARAAKRGQPAPVPNKTGKHPIDVIGREKAAADKAVVAGTKKSEMESHVSKLDKAVPLASPAALGTAATAPAAPALHNTVEGFMGNLKTLPKGGPDRGKFITAHMNHGPFLQALQQHPQGKQVHAMLTNHLNGVANAGPKAPMQVTAKSEAPVILTEPGNNMPIVETTYTPAEAVEILKKAAKAKIEAMEVQLQDLRKREAVKSMIPPHKHNNGSTASAGMEDVAPGKLHQTTATGNSTTIKQEIATAGSNMTLGEPMEDTPGEETSGERSPADVLDEAIHKSGSCEKCGLEKAVCKCELDKSITGGGVGGSASAQTGTNATGISGGGLAMAEMTDAKGKAHSVGDEPSATLPDDEGKHVNEPAHSNKNAGSGGTIRRGKSLKDIKKSALSKAEDKIQVQHTHSCDACGTTMGADRKDEVLCAKCKVKKAEPPMAKPPSGVNMATKVPTSVPKMGSAPKAPKMGTGMGMGKEEMPAAPSGSSNGMLSGADGAAGGLAQSEHRGGNLQQLRDRARVKKPLGKGVMADINGREAQHMGAPSVQGMSTSAPKAALPTPGQHAVRAAGHQAALAGAFQPKGPVHSGLELDVKPKLNSPRAAGAAPNTKPGIFGKLPKIGAK